MKKGLFLISVLAMCLMVPLTTEADSSYMGDYCWITSPGTPSVVILSVFSQGYDSRGHEIINYMGRWKGFSGAGQAFPINGNCISTVNNNNNRVYRCNMFYTDDGGSGLTFIEFNDSTLQGSAHGVGNVYEGNSVVSTPSNFTLTPMTCPDNW